MCNLTLNLMGYIFDLFCNFHLMRTKMGILFHDQIARHLKIYEILPIATILLLNLICKIIHL